MTTTAEHAIAIARVSSGKQKEEDQTPELARFAESKGYELDAIVPIHGKSAFHGRHVKDVLKAIDKHVRHDGAAVVIFRDVDRSSRQGAQATFDLRGEIIRAGARMEFAGQEYLNDQRTQEMLLGLLATAAREESETKSRRKLQGNAARSTAGKLNGRPPWGYAMANDVLVPNAMGREWVPKIYQAAVNGKSLRFIAVMLKDAGIPSPQQNGLWNQATIRRLIASPTYHGERVGKGSMVYEALVSTELWQQANAAVEGRTRSGRGTVKREPVLVKPYCGACLGDKRDGAPSGRAPMYRSSKDGHDYMACRGHGPHRKSCGAKLIPEADFNAALDMAMTGDTRPYRETVYVPGDDKAERLAAINERIAVAARQGDYALIRELGGEAEAIESQPHRKARTELRETGKTIGKHWESLKSDAERRDFLVTARVEVIAWMDNGNVAILTNHGPGF